MPQRVNSQPLCAVWSAQAATLAVAFGVARSQLEDPRGINLSSPAAILGSPRGTLCATACTQVIAANAMPLRMSPFSVLEAVSQIAKEELAHNLVTRNITHEVGEGAIRTLCRRASDLTQGDAVWAVLALVLFLSLEAEGRQLLREAGIGGYDLAVARVLLDFGHSEITRRFRLSEATAAAYRAMPPPSESAVDEVLRTVDALVHEESGSESTAETVPAKKERAKRKRSPLQAPASLEVALDWAHALTSSGQVHVLLMLIASTRTAARSAAATTLQNQTASAPDRITSAVSEEQAVLSRECLRPLFRQSDKETPRVIVWRSRDAEGKLTVCRGIARSENDLENTMFCFGKVSRWTLPHTTLVNVSAYHLNATGAASAPIPGYSEASYRILGEEASSAGKRDVEKIDRLKGLRKGETMSAALTGVSRCEIVLAMRLVVSRSALEAGERLVRAAQGVQEAHKGSSSYETAAVLHNQLLDESTEPFSTPSNNLAQGLQASETLRVLHKNKDHRGDPTRAQYGPEIFTGEVHEAEVSEFDKAQATMVIIDAETELIDGDHEPVPSRPDAAVVPMAVRLSLSGENPVRIPEAVAALMHHSAAEAMAVLLQAGAQVSLVNEETRNVLAGAATAASASAKRILLADFRNSYLTVFQAYRIGHRNIKTSFPSCSWAGAYGAGVEMGSGGGLGKASVFTTADRRHHGKLLDTQEIADEYNLAVAASMTKQVSDSTYDFVPPHVRGVPHLATPGVHSFLDEATAGLERLRSIAKIAGKTADSIQVLPIGPFSENLCPGTTPDLDQTASLGFRNVYDRLSTDGKSYLPDMTVDDVSVFREPLVERMAVRNVVDCPYASAHEHLTSWFESVAMLAVMSSLLLPNASPAEKVRRLYDALGAFHRGGGVQPAAFFASRAAVLLSSMYPRCFSISRESIETAYARAAGPATTAFKGGSAGCLPDLVPEELVYDARDFWRAFETGGWERLRPLLQELVRLDGTCDMSVKQLRNFKNLVDDAILAAWDVSLENGKPKQFHPLEGLTGPEQINATHVSPIFAQRDDGTYPRGALVGMKPGSFRSLLCLLLGAEQVEETQVYRNEGGLLLRPSSAADIFDINNRPRTAKSCSPVGVEGDELAYGTRTAKVLGCQLQRAAWEKNLRLLIPLCTAISLPLPEQRRRRGSDAQQREVAVQEHNAMTSGTMSADRAMARAAADVVHKTMTRSH